MLQLFKVSYMKFKSCLNGNILKILACIFMVIDHIGYFLFPKIKILRYIGRLAFPMFAFFISEGCKYTKHRVQYWGMITLLGIMIFLVQYVVLNKIMGNVLLSFSVAILLIYLLQEIKKTLNLQKNTKKAVFLIFLLILALVSSYFISIILDIDYGFVGILLPFIISLPDFSAIDVNPKLRKFDNLYTKLLLMFFTLIVLSLTNNLKYEWFCLLSILPLLLYNGKRGKLNLKYLFYIFYPLHIVIIYGIQFLIK